MKEPWQIAVKFENGSLVILEMHHGETAKKFGRTLWALARIGLASDGIKSEHLPIGVQVWKSHRSTTPAVQYGPTFTY